MSTDIKLSKAQISKIIQFSGFLGSLAGPLMKVAVPLAKTILVPLGITAANSAIDAGKKWFWGNNFNNLKQRNDSKICCFLLCIIIKIKKLYAQIADQKKNSFPSSSFNKH